MATASVESEEKVRNTYGTFMLSSCAVPPIMKSATWLGVNWLMTASMVGENGPMTTLGSDSSSFRSAGSASTESAASSALTDFICWPSTPPLWLTSYMPVSTPWVPQSDSWAFAPVKGKSSPTVTGPEAEPDPEDPVLLQAARVTAAVPTATSARSVRPRKRVRCVLRNMR